jgi:hypothetical protein
MQPVAAKRLPAGTLEDPAILSDDEVMDETAQPLPPKTEPADNPLIQPMAPLVNELPQEDSMFDTSVLERSFNAMDVSGAQADDEEEQDPSSHSEEDITEGWTISPYPVRLRRRGKGLSTWQTSSGREGRKTS